ncbi:Protein of unknown function [Bacillus mycoides]|nr:Protein of unknown function [Bacillus mycoides]
MDSEFVIWIGKGI